MKEEMVTMREELEIDQYSLDKEWVNQPIRFSKYALKHVETLYEKDKKIKQLELKKATLDSEVRTNPDILGLSTKVTEGSIKSHIDASEEVVQLEKEVLELKKKVNILAVVREAFDQRRSALENEVKLWLGQYYADPQVKGSKFSTTVDEEVVGKQIRKGLEKQ